MAYRRFLIRRDEDLWEVIDPREIYYLEARDHDTLVRLRRAQTLHDVRRIGELETLFAGHDFLRVHRSFVVNLDRVRLVRRRDDGRDWELKMEPPVNRVLPISRSELPRLLQALGSGEVPE